MQPWIDVFGAPNLRSCEYSFGPGMARSFAVRGPRGWVVVSPPCNADDTVFSGLDADAPVAALVAPNAFHHMGLRAWHERYPQARLFAPAQAITRVEKKSKVTRVAPVADSRDVCGDVLELLDMPHYKTGEVLVRAPSPKGPVWHVTDVIFNWPQVPPGLMAKLLFSVLSDSAPGFKLSAPAAFLMIKDKRGVYRWLKELAQRDAPVRIVPSHGVDLVLDPPGQQLIELLTISGKA